MARARDDQAEGFATTCADVADRLSATERAAGQALFAAGQ
jgi:hypothetical protein